jgi:NAD-dependent dihydropyrimidine dehydrogenase PreA subunit
MGKPNWVEFGWMQNLILPNFKKKVPQSKFICKSYGRFTEARPGHGFRRPNMTQNQNQLGQNLVVCHGNCSARLMQWMERLKQGFTTNLGFMK